jgi:hypothetical protein
MSGTVSNSSGSGVSSSHPQLNPTQMLDLYNQYLPQSLQTTSGQAGQTANNLANGAAGANPIYTQSGLDQLNGLAGGYQQAGANLAAQQAASQNALINGAGGATARSANALSNELNPAQAASNAQASNLVNSINLNGLSGGEQAAVERSLNQSNYATGNLGLDNATNAVSNAMNFGNALQAKRSALGSALGAAGGVAANQNSFVNPVGTALNSGNTASNFGLGTYNPTQANANITAPLTFGSSLGNQITGISSSSISKGANTSASSSENGGINCCFIFLEATNGVMPWWVRQCRDEYYVTQPSVATGYKRMAKWLVPLMKRFSIVKTAVNAFMVTPITNYGGWLKGVEGYENGQKFEVYKKFWFFVWKLTGNK